MRVNLLERFESWMVTTLHDGNGINLCNRYGKALGFLAANEIEKIFSNIYQLKKYEYKNYSDMVLSYGNNILIFDFFPSANKRIIPFLKEEKKTNKVFAPPPIMEFSRAKKLITTPINGNTGEIVENWGTDDYEIKLRGIVIDVEERNYPTKLIKEMHKLFAYDGLVEACGTQFSEKDIQFIYFKEIDINPIEGFADTVSYTLTAKSSKEVNLNVE